MKTITHIMCYLFLAYTNGVYAQKNAQPLVSPCNFKYELQGIKRLPDWLDANGKYHIDSVVIRKEITAEKKHGDGVMCIDRRNFVNFWIALYVSNGENYDTEYSILFGNDAMMSLEFYKVDNKKMIPLPIENPSPQMYGYPLKAHKVDSTFSFSIETSAKIDTGIIYMIRAKYRQKCGKQIKTKYTSRVMFRLIE